MTKKPEATRIKVQHPHAGNRGWELAYEPGLEQVCQNITEDTAHRLAACWNACIGIETYALELMTGDLSIHRQITSKRVAKLTPKAIEYRRQRDALLNVLEHIEGVALADEPRDLPGIAQTARAAIAKAEGAPQ